LFETVVKAIVFLGGGRITSALVAGLRLAGYDRPIIVHDRHARKLQELKRQYGVIAEPDLRRAVESAHLLILAVRPDSMRGLLKEINSDPIRRMVVVSLAAGIPLSTLRSLVGRPVQWVRAMPSPVCRSRQGLTALSFGRGLSSAKRAEVRALFARVGAVVEVPEKQFDAFTVTFSSSHGYHSLAALIEAAETQGLDRQTACLAAAHALCDGIASWRAGNLSLEKLLQEAATPGGTAAAVIASLDAAGYHRMVEKGLRAGIRQARKNSPVTDL
jgi:pyrroline-5-carboxylate reductase